MLTSRGRPIDPSSTSPILPKELDPANKALLELFFKRILLAEVALPLGIFLTRGL